MLQHLHKLLTFLFILLFSANFCHAEANDEDTEHKRFMRASHRIYQIDQGDETPITFSDVEQLHNLVETLDWANSDDPQKQELYKQLADAVKNIDDLETAEMEAKLQELRDDAEAAHERENSTVNKMLGGAAIGAMGIAGMELASAMSEKKAMADAELDMSAYLTTFVCDYGAGRNIKGGEVDVELPSSPELSTIKAEYIALATDLKERKTALGMQPGIESELILEAATTGLYDNESLGKADGVYTSLSRALLDDNGTDAAEWNAEKERLDKKIKDSATAIAVTAVASIAANLMINGKNRKQIAESAEKTRVDVRALLDRVIEECNEQIATTQDPKINLLTDYEDLKTLKDHPICK